MEIQGQSVIVTGGASGIGKATALLLAHEGARVFVGDIDEAGGQAAAAEAAAERLAIEYLPLDLTDPPSIAGFAAAVHQRTDRVHGLVNGAGWDQIQPFLENPPEIWDRIVAVNLMGVVRLTRGVLSAMVAARAGNRKYIERCGAGRQHGRNRLCSCKGRADRLYQVARARTRALSDQRQLRLSGPDRHAAVPQPARAYAGRVDAGDSLPQRRPAGRHRRGGDVFCRTAL